MTGRMSRIRNASLAALLVLALATAGALLLGAHLRPAPSLQGFSRLIQDRRFDEAEQLLRDYLTLHPASLQANLLMAQVALDRADQKPSLALEHLGRIKAADARTRAIVLLNEGKAYSVLGSNDRAARAWKDALRTDRYVPEAGWDLLGLYYVQGRRAEAHALGLALHGTEPDPRDRVQLLLELVRQDAQPLGAYSLVQTLEPIVHAHPEELHTPIALGLALIRNGRAEDGLSMLSSVVRRFGADIDAHDALLRGLDEARRPGELGKALSELPAGMAADPRFARYRGAASEQARDWAAAADAYLLAWRADPSDFQVLYRLSRMLRASGRLEQAEPFDRHVRAAQTARNEVLALFKEADAQKTLGVAPHPDLYHRLADLRERMGHGDEAIAWHRLVLEYSPDDPISCDALARLQPASSRAENLTDR
jgi:tetratricopeptide (TPR) repeat protein